MHRIRGKLTYSNVVSTLCLVLVLGGGTAYAATTMLPKNSVGARQIKKGSITPAKLSKAVTSTLAGPAGPKGATGATGAAGPLGPQGKEGKEGKEGKPGHDGASVPQRGLFAQVSDGDKLLGDHPGFTAVSSPATGIYCLTVETGVDYRYPVASVEWLSSGGSNLLVEPLGSEEQDDCAAGQLEVHTYKIEGGGVTASNSIGFTVLLAQP